MKTSVTKGACIHALLLMGVATGLAQAESTQSNSSATATSSPRAKAYKTLNFGDANETVEGKLGEIVVNGRMQRRPPEFLEMDETLWRSLFDTDAEYQPYRFDPSRSSQSDKLRSVMRYFQEVVGVDVLSSGNSAISIDCFQLKDRPSSRGGALAVVAVSYYETPDLDKLIESFTQNYPNCRWDKKTHRVESTVYPGVFLEFERSLLADADANRKATLSIPTGKFTFTFTDPSKLPKEKLAVWERLMAQDGRNSQMKEFFDSVRTSLLELAKNIESAKATPLRLDSLTYLGWYDNRIYETIIYGGPKAVFASKQVIGTHMNNYRQSIAANDQAEKARKKKESDGATGF